MRYASNPIGSIGGSVDCFRTVDWALHIIWESIRITNMQLHTKLNVDCFIIRDSKHDCKDPETSHYRIHSLQLLPWIEPRPNFTKNLL